MLDRYPGSPWFWIEIMQYRKQVRIIDRFLQTESSHINKTIIMQG